MGFVLAASAYLRASAIMNASIASPWHRARTPVGNGRNRCSVCQRYLGRQHQRGWTAAACSADNEVLAPNFFSSRARGRGAPRCVCEADDLRRSQDSFHPDQKNFRQHCTAPWSRAYLLALLARIVLGANESANEARPRRGKARESAAIACRENWTVMIVSWCQRVNLR